MAIVNLGNEKLNINTTTAKGLEKIIGIIGKFIISAQTQSNTILYGKGEINPNAIGLEKITQKGVVNVIGDISNVDFCNLINYSATQTNISPNRFDPNGPPENATPKQIKIWNIQNFAFKIQQKIDQYYSQYGSATGQDSRLGLIELINSINLNMESLLSSSEGLNDPDILKEFPEMSTATNYLDNALAKFSDYTNVRNIPVEEVQKVIKFIDKVRIICSSIISLNLAASLLNAANLIAGNRIQEQINIINKYITPGPKVVILLKEVIKKVNNVNTVAKKVLGYINLARTIIKLGLLLIKVFTIIRKFLFGIPLPAAFVPVGATTAAADVSQNVVKEQGIDKPIKRLQQLNLVLNLIAIFVTSLVGALTTIIQNLSAIVLNIESCSPDLAKEMQNTIDDLNNTRSQLQKFLDDYNNTKNLVDKTFGGYTIEIVTEEVVDEGISLRRRYGIARGSDNIIAVQSTPTFASLDLIIINEVKVLLVSKGLVNVGLGGLNTQDSQVIIESLNYLGDPDITLNDIDLNPTQVAGLLDDSNISDISTFMNNLPGGKALRNKVRKRLGEQKQKLGKDLKDTDPNSKYTSNIIQN